MEFIILLTYESLKWRWFEAQWKYFYNTLPGLEAWKFYFGFDWGKEKKN